MGVVAKEKEEVGGRVSAWSKKGRYNKYDSDGHGFGKEDWYED